MSDLEPKSLVSQIQPKSRGYKVVADEPETSTPLQAAADPAEPFQHDSSATPAFGRSAAAAIAEAQERVSEAIHRRLDELALLRADIDAEAAEFVRLTSERATTLQSHIESYARQCADVQQQIKDAGKRLIDPIQPL